MQALGMSLWGLGVACLLLMAGHIFWREMVRLAYLSRLDEWGEDVPPWQ